VNSQTSESQIQFTWNALSTLLEIGGTPILSYNVQWDRGFNGQAWYHLAGYSFDLLTTSYTASALITKGTTYRIRIRAKNYWGWGPLSDELLIKASTIPSKLAVVVTSIDQTSGNVRVTWTHPYDNSDTVTGYKIEALRNDGVWTTVCSELDSSIVITRQCIVQMSQLHFDFALPFKHIA